MNDNPYRSPVSKPSGDEPAGPARATLSDRVSAIFLGLIAAVMILPVSFFVIIVLLSFTGLFSYFKIATMPVLLFSAALSIVTGWLVANSSLRGVRKDFEPNELDRVSDDE